MRLLVWIAGLRWLLWRAASYVPGTGPHRKWRDATAWLDEAERMVATVYPGFPRYPREAVIRHPVALGVAVDHMIAALRAAAATMNGASRKEATAVLEEHMPFRLVAGGRDPG